jgi:putative transposase
VSITCWRYEAKLRTDNAQIEVDLIALSESHKRWGFGLIYLHLRNVQGKTWNHKRIYRIYRQLALNLRIKPRDCDTFGIKRTRPEPLNVPSTPTAYGQWTSCTTT